MQVKIQQLAELAQVAQQLIAFCQGQKFIIFKGEMGAGKTTFIKTLCAQLGVTETVSSPTFSIVNEYEYLGGLIYHFDFYRLKNLNEVYDIGYEDYFYSDNYCLIEWPQKIEDLLPEQYVEVKIIQNLQGDREFNFRLQH
jgi:tRNA threonylcarbamoyladenosine biosynthesis protein TsaE